MSNSLLKSLEEGKGYHITRMEKSDLCTLRAMVRDQWLSRMQEIQPDEFERFKTIPMDHYHRFCDGFDHKSLWTKYSRMLSERDVETIKKLDFIKTLECKLGKFVISNEDRRGCEEIYWRIIRPGNMDVGAMHADGWFWDMYDWPSIPGRERIKVWISLYTVKGKNGLRIIPNSQKKLDWKFRAEKRDGVLKPVFYEDEAKLDIIPAPLEPGDIIVFHDLLVHGGMVSTVDRTRVSLEMTLFIDKTE